MFSFFSRSKKLLLLFLIILLFTNYKICFSQEYNFSIAENISLEKILGTSDYIITDYDFYDDKFIIISTKDGKLVSYNIDNGDLKFLGHFTNVFSVWDMGLNAIKIDRKSKRLYFHTQFNYGSHVEFKVGYFPILTENEDIKLDVNDIRIIFSSPLSISLYVHTGAIIYQQHNGDLLIGVGDYGPFENPNHVQVLDNINGKILQMDKEGNALSTNPFYDGTNSIQSYIYAWGLRNPYVMVKDEINNNLYLADLGLLSREEINLLKKNKNYGWPVYEGELKKQEEISIDHEFPFYTYGRSFGCAITGLEYNYFDSKEESLLFLDFCTGVIRKINLNNKEVTDVHNFGSNKSRYKMKFFDNSLFVASNFDIVVLENNIPRKITYQPDKILFSSFDTHLFFSLNINTQKNFEKYVVLNDDNIVYEGGSNKFEINIENLNIEQPLKVLAFFSDGILESLPIELIQRNDPRPIITVDHDISVCNDVNYIQPDADIAFIVKANDFEGESLDFLSNLILHHDDHTHFIQSYSEQNFSYKFPSSFESGSIFYELKIVSEEDRNGLQGISSVYFYPEPELLLSTNKSDTTICTGDEIIFKATGFYKYTWFEGDKIISEFDSLVVKPDRDTSYKIIARSEDGCNEKEKNFSVNVLKEPLLQINSDKENHLICEGEEITFSASGLFNYRWMEGDNEMGNGSSITFVPQPGTQYSIKAEDEKGCFYKEHFLDINIIPLYPEQPVVTTVPDTFQLGLLTTQYNSNVKWIKNDKVISEDKYFLPDENGTYYAIYQVNDCQSPLSQGFEVVTTDVEELFKKVKIYPNPVYNNLINIKVPFFTKPIEARYILYSPSGKSLISGNLREETEILDLVSLTAGVYFLKLILNEKIHNYKVLKTH